MVWRQRNYPGTFKDVSPNRITDIVNGKRGISADTDLHLTKLFGLSEGYFLRF
ncbi:plasmid maintenance system antidote protein, XRE family [Leadbettera azotonutricia ZAS-9]|uniref:Plasmid maintenance system antidote protein, XRE family n=1 Tax=Leadbettera azotonutricia (strain ATCC BAA-888 / DSM 13862 / ZAS-9) TaxID=545695 RepID=F5Y6Y9_LEAAZ|nr:plasmid maintenance system antidote protein, XRE family [Leadbettera azotonutricia ZAS-9]